jgi:hypothetical protein
VLDRAGVRVSSLRVTQAYLELAVFIRALAGLGDGARMHSAPDRAALWAGLFDPREPARPRGGDLRALAA